MSRSIKTPRALTSQGLTRNGLNPYTGPWGYEQAAHLLRRTMFGPTYKQIKWAVQRGLEGAIDELFKDIPMPDPPINVDYRNDPYVPVGSTWVEAPYPPSNFNDIMKYRNFSLRAWAIEQILKEQVSIREKLTLFWHNHFPLEAIQDSKFLYRYITLLRKNAWGNFRELTKAMTIDPAMLRYLDGRKNRKHAPNENYARELLELFTIGKGPIVAPGDYTNFTEQDVYEIARILTGWRDFGFTHDSNNGEIGSVFQPFHHDTGVKTLSHRFGNAVIPDMGDQEYAYLIDLIFQQKEVARFICRKLYQWFVYYQINVEVEQAVIEPMADILIQHDYEVQPALKALLSSVHFYEDLFSGAMIKHPLDLVMSGVKTMEFPLPNNVEQRYYVVYSLFGLATRMQMKYFSIPQVAGWRAYYLAPVYYRDWISASTLPVRMEFINKFCGRGISPFKGNGPRIRVNPLDFLTSIEQPRDPNSVVKEFTQILLPKPLTAEVRRSLKDILIPGLPDFEWTVEYNNYLQDPSDTNLADAIEVKLRNLLNSIMSMAEFQLS